MTRGSLPSGQEVRQLLRDRQLYDRARTLFERLIELDEEQRRAELARQDDPRIRRFVAWLLESEGTLQPVPPAMGIEGEEWIDRRLGEYVLREQIGEGGSSLVFRAEGPAGDVAIKLLRVRRQDPRERLRFEREAAILQGLDHPTICRLLATGKTDDGTPFLVMELVDGQPITDYCDQQRLTIRGRVQLFASVCEGVQGAHLALVAHRDLKPSNILVSRQGAPRILDFGIAKLLETDTSETTTRNRPLTLAWASPEQLQGASVGAATDVYSLGRILYFVLTGREPDQRDDRSIAEILEALRRSDPIAPSRVVRNCASPVAETRGTAIPGLSRSLRGDLDLICSRALAYDVKHRYPSAGELAADLRRHLNGQPVSADTRGALHRLSTWARRKPLRAAAVLALISVGCVAAVQARIEHLRLEAERDRATKVVDLLSDSFGLLTPVDDERDRERQRRRIERSLEDVLPQLWDHPDEAARLVGSIDLAFRSLGDEENADRLLEETLASIGMGSRKETVRRLELELGWFAIRLGDDRRAETFARRALESDPGPEMESAGRRLLGLALARRGDTDAGVHQLRRAVAAATEAQAPRAEVEAKVALSEGLSLAGDSEAALLVLEDVEDLAAETFPPGHATLVELDSGRVTALIAAGRYAEAEPLALRAVAGAQAVYGEPNETVAGTLHQLALIKEKLDRLDEAESLYQRAIEMSVQLLGPDHHDPTVMRSNFAVLLERKGEGRRAVALQRENLQRFIDRYGEVHDQVAFAANNLGATLVRLGEFEEPLVLYELALDAFDSLHGSASPQVAMVRNNLGAVRMFRGDLDEAQAQFVASQEIVVATLGADHPYAGVLANNLGRVAFDRGDFETSKRLHRRAITIAEAAGAIGSQAQASYDLATTLSRIGDQSGAIDVSRAAVGLRRRAFGDRHRDTSLAKLQLAALQTMGGETGSVEDAEAAFHEVCQHVDDGHPARALAQRDLAGALLAAGHIDAALDAAAAAYEAASDVFPGGSWRTSTCAAVLAEALAAAGRLPEAIELAGQHTSILMRCCGPASPAATMAAELSLLGSPTKPEVGGPG